MRKRRVYADHGNPTRAEKHSRVQPETSDAARFIAAARIKSSKPAEIPIGRDVDVATEKAAGAFPEVGDHDDIGFVIAGARFDPRLPLTHIVGTSHIRISVSSADLQATEFVDQEEVHHTRDSVGTVHRRSAILENVHVIDHRKRYEVDVRAGAGACGTQRTKGYPLAINEN